MTEIALKKKYRTGRQYSKGGAYRTRTGNSNGRIKLSKAKRAALGKGEKKAVGPA